jgi:cytochrome c553
MKISRFLSLIALILSAASNAFAADIAKGKELTEKHACTSCHGVDFNKTIDMNTPKLAGQYPDYLYIALKSYQVKGNRIVGRENPVMFGMVENLTLVDMQNISAYVSQLPGSMKTISQPSFK